MGRFDPKYTDRQREAVIAAIVDRGMSAPKACKRAAEGTLEDDLEPFDFPPNTARDYARRERNKRAGRAARAKEQGTIEDRLEAFGDRAMAMLEHGLDRLEHKQKKRKQALSSNEIERGRKLTSWARELRSLNRNMPVGKSGTTKRREAEGQQHGPPQDPASDLAKRMEADLTAAEPRQGPRANQLGGAASPRSRVANGTGAREGEGHSSG